MAKVKTKLVKADANYKKFYTKSTKGNKYEFSLRYSVTPEEGYIQMNYNDEIIYVDITAAVILTTVYYMGKDKQEHEVTEFSQELIFTE